MVTMFFRFPFALPLTDTLNKYLLSLNFEFWNIFHESIFLYAYAFICSKIASLHFDPKLFQKFHLQLTTI